MTIAVGDCGTDFNGVVTLFNFKHLCNAAGIDEYLHFPQELGKFKAQICAAGYQAGLRVFKHQGSKLLD